MNKKFSTLVASLLVSSTFGVYNVGAVPVLANQTQIETRATLPAEVEDAVEWTGAALPTTLTGLENRVLDGFTNNSLLVIANKGAGGIVQGLGSQDYFDFGGYNSSAPEYAYWTLQSDGRLMNNAGQTFSVYADKDYFEIIPLLDNGKATKYFVLAQRADNGDLEYLVAAASAGTSNSFSFNSVLSNATVFASVETEYTNAAKGEEVNDVLGDAFNLIISSLKDADATITNAEAFAGDLVAMKNEDDLETTATTYYIKNGDKFVVFDSNAETTSDGFSENGKFVLVDYADITNYTCYKFQIKFADNGSDAVKVVAAGSDNQYKYRLYIANVNDTYGLTVGNMWGDAQNAPAVNWAAVVLGDNNWVNLKQYLSGDFYTVDFVSSESTADEYKDGGRLAIREKTNGTDYADYVDASSLYSKAPEAQWAVSSSYNATTKQAIYDGTITLTNRENPSVKVDIDGLRYVDGVGLMVTAGSSINAPRGAGLAVGDVIKINVVTNHDKHDGYEVFSDNDLRNETYYLGQIRQAEGEDINVYWAENHAASHQIGATVEQANATKWNLSLVKKDLAKDHESEVDSVLVISELQQWNPTKNRIDVQSDTLVILPYAFQNRSNNEFAQFNNGTNLKYYQCDADNKKDGYVYSTDAMFALKRKADINGEPVYNYVALKARKAKDYTAKGWVPTTTEGEWYATEKVYQENSTDHGTWKNMKMYDGDANALMFVTKVEAPEYRKLVTTAALDTIKLYRGDNEAQVVYEKRDDKSVVDGRTLSFLNIDNDTQFTDINPALYADTAYVNRGNNTCWQYLLGVNIEHVDGYYCPTHGFAVTPPCEHAKPVSYNTGRYLINMIDTANVYGQTAGIHNNPYINETEEGMDCAKLSFVDAIHVLTDPMDETAADKLYVINGTEEGDTVAIDLSTPNFNIAKFAFKYMDSMNSDEFKIQTLWKQYAPGTKEADLETSQEGYLRWVNGCIVVDKTFQKGDVFNMDENETRTPTANEEISAEAGAVSVVATDGAIIVKGAEGKNVVVATILGKVVANEVATSDNETIAVPAGIAVVAVDGESFKVVVK